MRINRENYESYLVDYSEGVLSTKLRQEVENFLMLNPDIQEEFEMFSSDLIETDPVNFLEKEDLKKIPFEETSAYSPYFQGLCIAQIDGLLSESESGFLKKLVMSDVKKKKELAAFEKTKLIVENINFNEKILLKQPKIIHSVTKINFEEYCIACMEGWLDQAGLVELNNYLENNRDQRRVFELYFKTRITPDLSIVYPDKSKIKRFVVLSPKNKKFFSIASSVAAILVIGLMVFYASTTRDKAQLSGNVSASFIQKIKEVQPSLEQIKADKGEKTERIQNPTLFPDSVGFEKIVCNERLSGTADKLAEHQVVSPLKTIKITQIDCPPCKPTINNKLLVKREIENWDRLVENVQETNATSNQKASKKSMVEQPVRFLAQAGINGFNKFTKSELKVEKSKGGDKTTIAFNSKYFSFATQVNKK